MRLISRASEVKAERVSATDWRRVGALRGAASGLGAPLRVVSLAPAERLIGAPLARAEGAVARAALEAELTRDRIVLGYLVGERVRFAVHVPFAGLDGEVHGPDPIEQGDGRVEGAGADVDDALAS